MSYPRHCTGNNDRTIFTYYLKNEANDSGSENIQQWLWCVSWETGNRQISGVYERFDEGIVVVELFTVFPIFELNYCLR